MNYFYIVFFLDNHSIHSPYERVLLDIATKMELKKKSVLKKQINDNSFNFLFYEVS